MPSNDPLSAEQIEQFREQLRELRDRLLGDVEYVSEAIREEINPTGNLSNTPIHLADSADGQVDADIQVIESERELLTEVQAALHRIDNHTYGKCVNCGNAIALGRLQLLPYAARCIACANRQDNPDDEAGPDSAGESERLRLTGFEAIEIAEKEGLRLNKLSDSIDEAAHGLTIAEAKAIASDNPELIWLEIAADDYGVRKNMRPGR